MSWSLIQLKDLGDIQTGSTPSTTDDGSFGGDIPFVTPGDLDQTAPIQSAARSLTQVGADQSRLLPENTVLVCCIGSLGKVGIAGRPLVTNQQINAIVFNHDRIFPRYGFFACRRLKRVLETLAPATTVPIVNKTRFSELRIPVPPLPEQRRIAAVLDQAETLRTQRRAALAQLDSLTQSLFLDMFGDPVSGKSVWPKVRLGDLAADVQIGPFGSLLHQEDYVEGGVPLINPMHIKFGRLEPDSSQSITKSKHAQLSLYHLRVGDVVMGRRGEMGRCAVVSEEHDGILCGTGSLFVRPNQTSATSQYLFAVLSHSSMKSHLESISLGATMPNLNKGIVAGLQINVPPLPLQQTFATRVQAIEALKAQHRAALAEADALFASLQQRAFAGGL